MMAHLVQHPRYTKLDKSPAALNDHKNLMLDDDYGGLLLAGQPSLLKESTLNSTNQSQTLTNSVNLGLSSLRAFDNQMIPVGPKTGN